MHQTFFYFQLSLNVLMKRLTASPKAGNYPPSSNDPDKGFGGSDDKDLSKTPLLGSNDSLVGEKYNMVTIFFYNTPKKKKNCSDDQTRHLEEVQQKARQGWERQIQSDSGWKHRRDKGKKKQKTKIFRTCLGPITTLKVVSSFAHLSLLVLTPKKLPNYFFFHCCTLCGKKKV